MKYTKIVMILLMASAYGHAQQQPNFLFFEQNMGLYNPAATGTQGSFAGIGYRAAWSGIEDAPRATSFIYNTTEKNNASWGFSYLSDQVYVENQGVVSIDYSYKLQLSESTKLFLGIKAGGIFNNIDLNKLNRITQESNESLGNIDNYMNPAIGVGAFIQSKKFFAGISVPNFLNSKRFKESNGIATTATDKPHFYGTAGLSIPLGTNILLRPMMLYRVVSDAPNQITALGQIELKEQLSIGVGVSNNDYVSAMLLFKGMQRLDFGYGYEMGQRTSATALRANTHELILRYKFGVVDKK
ncbi:PorP/SprF family type IX secretion system membrane protein [Flavobacteriaceae bacterium]|nr:PorP/SprF family type IX secretion system membrane protein [Flavobacteriaceae bacterium]